MHFFLLWIFFLASEKHRVNNLPWPHALAVEVSWISYYYSLLLLRLLLSFVVALNLGGRERYDYINTLRRRLVSTRFCWLLLEELCSEVRKAVKDKGGVPYKMIYVCLILFPTLPDLGRPQSKGIPQSKDWAPYFRRRAPFFP